MNETMRAQARAEGAKLADYMLKRIRTPDWAKITNATLVRLCLAAFAERAFQLGVPRGERDLWIAEACRGWKRRMRQHQAHLLGTLTLPHPDASTAISHRKEHGGAPNGVAFRTGATHKNPGVISRP